MSRCLISLRVFLRCTFPWPPSLCLFHSALLSHLPSYIVLASFPLQLSRKEQNPIKTVKHNPSLSHPCLRLPIAYS
ncbi:hypothetical protein BC834DRAFT_861918 [Gloeopeniophorella convolvens]|nr:hypothetical protein BC834DRAFT_861918 [Gloeopeniophorella convolvens]